MFYKYSQAINRLIPTSRLSAYSPQGLTPYRVESGFIVYDTKSTRPVKQGEAFTEAGRTGRGMASSAAPTAGAGTPGAGGEVPNASGYRRVMELQKLMTKDDGLLVWMKRGARDSLPYYTTIALVIGGLGYCGYILYKMSMPKKQ